MIDFRCGVCWIYFQVNSIHSNSYWITSNVAVYLPNFQFNFITKFKRRFKSIFFIFSKINILNCTIFSSSWNEIIIFLNDAFQFKTFNCVDRFVFFNFESFTIVYLLHILNAWIRNVVVNQHSLFDYCSDRMIIIISHWKANDIISS